MIRKKVKKNAERTGTDSGSVKGTEGAEAGSESFKGAEEIGAWPRSVKGSEGTGAGSTYEEQNE